jgi:FSR family fosmidomycin resistance protein-like MFS transporter
MEPGLTLTSPEKGTHKADTIAFSILAAVSFCHLLNDMLQSLVPAIYPLLKISFHLDFRHIGMITLAYQLTASILQPCVGFYTDRRPHPYSLPLGMACTLFGLIALSTAADFPALLVAASLVGLGSAVFHPESSRVARMASGGAHGLAQSVFQVGGNVGAALGPLLAAFIVLPRGRRSLLWFCSAALVAIVVLVRVSNWYQARDTKSTNAPKKERVRSTHPAVSPKKAAFSIAILAALVFSKSFYLASLTSYFTFFLMSKFHISVVSSEIHLFLFLAAVATGTILGGPFGDRFGSKYVIWCSILGVLPFTLLLPYANLFWTGVLSLVIGVILASAFPAIVVYAHELVPDRVGMISGLFFGLAFGIGGIGAAILGWLADLTSLEFVYRICSSLPLIGLLTALLPNIERTGSIVHSNAAVEGGGSATALSGS